jgi:uncharacterized protein
MLVLDVNVLLAAHRADHPQYDPVRRWLDSLLAARTDFGVPSFVWASFLRLATHRRVFVVPTPLGDALDFVDAMTAQPGHVATEPGARHLALVRQICVAAEASGDLVPDAVLAAVAVEHGAAVATLDRDFARFESVRRVRPGDPGRDAPTA